MTSYSVREVELSLLPTANNGAVPSSPASIARHRYMCSTRAGRYHDPGCWIRKPKASFLQRDESPPGVARGSEGSRARIKRRIDNTDVHHI
jgi:hypothetical protein